MKRPIGFGLVVTAVGASALLVAGPLSTPASAIQRTGPESPPALALPSATFAPPSAGADPTVEPAETAPVLVVPQPTALTVPDPPPCRSSSGDILVADVPAADRAPDQWGQTLVDTLATLGRGYVPPDLVPVGRAGIAGGGTIRKLVINDLRALDQAARAAGVHLRVVSAYRSYQKQQSTFAHWVAVGGYRQAIATSARPGHSEHQLGTVIDFGEVGRPDPWNQSFAASKAGRWLHDNAAQFGFVVSYPAGRQDEVCYDPEPWHLRYVGRDEAAAIDASGLALRTWLWRSSAPTTPAETGAPAPSGDASRG